MSSLFPSSPNTVDRLPDASSPSWQSRMRTYIKGVAVGLWTLFTMSGCDAFKDDVLPSCTHINSITKTSEITNELWCFKPGEVLTFEVCTEENCLAGTYTIEMSYLDQDHIPRTERLLITNFRDCLNVSSQAVPTDFCARVFRIIIRDADGNVVAEELMSP